MGFLKLDFRQWLLVVLVILAIVLGFFYWRTIWKNKDEVEIRGDAAAEEFVKNYEEAMGADTYGGKTPEETLNLFVEALKKEDVELASKYFLLDDEGKRDKWVEYLQGVKDKGLMKQMAEDIEKEAKPGKSSYKEDYVFELIDSDGSVGVSIDMEFNKFANVWKIESL